MDFIHNLDLCLGHEDIPEESILDFDCEDRKSREAYPSLEPFQDPKV